MGNKKLSAIIPEIDLKRIEKALESTPTAAYTAPHDYPHGAPMFQSSPCAERERVDSDQMRLYISLFATMPVPFVVIQNVSA